MSQYPTWAAGEDITADKLSAGLTMAVWKTAATTRASTTTAVDDPDLVMALAAGATYFFDLWVFNTGAAIGTGDIKVAVNYSGTSSGYGWIGTGIATTGATATNVKGNAIGTGTQAFGVNGGTFGDIKITGSIATTTAGNLSLQWAQNTSNATNTVVRAGSYLRAWRVA